MHRTGKIASLSVLAVVGISWLAPSADAARPLGGHVYGVGSPASNGIFVQTSSSGKAGTATIYCSGANALTTSSFSFKGPQGKFSFSGPLTGSGSSSPSQIKMAATTSNLVPCANGSGNYTLKPYKTGFQLPAGQPVPTGLTLDCYDCTPPNQSGIRTHKGTTPAIVYGHLTPDFGGTPIQIEWRQDFDRTPVSETVYTDANGNFAAAVTSDPAGAEGYGFNVRAIFAGSSARRYVSAFTYWVPTK